MVLSCLLLAVGSRADEGMWMLGNLNKETRRTMKELGLQLSAKQLYHPRRPSLKDAVVSFGGFCSGVVVSHEGLVLTNHHCGFSSIRQRSTMEHNYLRDGFVAHNRDEEIPCPELFVRFLIRQENVTRRVLSVVKPGMDEAERSLAIDSVMWTIGREVMMHDSTTVGAVDAYYGGNEFWLSVYRDYYDVRLVFAPPSSVGKFGWEEDNWEWPRHTGDFSVFRIYANQENLPAEYSADNVPYRPAYVAPISLGGYREGSFCMTLGYPGTTERYLSSFGIEEMMLGANQAQIDVRGVKQAIWKREMERNDSIRLMYASKYDESSNYWKNSIGMNQAIRRLHVLDKKRAMEKELRRWIENTPRERKKLSTLFTDLETNYKERREADRANAYFTEAFFNAPELVQLALSILNFDFEGERDAVVAGLENIVEQYANLDVDIDKEVFASMIDVYRARVDSTYWPVFFQEIDTLYGGNSRAYVDTLYARSDLTSPRGLKRFLERDTTYHIYEDPAITLSIDLLAQLFEMNYQVREPSREIRRGERLLNAAVRRMYDERNFYPDANSTLRIAYGKVQGYSPADAVYYRPVSTLDGIMEKDNPRIFDYNVPQKLRDIYASKDYGEWEVDGSVPVAFIATNHTTGGNSGSPVLDAEGNLIGVNFDRVWEGTMSDLVFDPDVCRNIALDIRYALFIIDKVADADYLMDEMVILK